MRRDDSFNPEPAARPATVEVNRQIAPGRDDRLCRADRRDRMSSINPREAWPASPQAPG